MTYDLDIAISRWHFGIALFLMAVMLLLLIYLRRRHILFDLAIVSVLVAIAIAIISPLTWHTGYLLGPAWQRPKANGNFTFRNLCFWMDCGAFKLELAEQNRIDPFPYGEAINLTVSHGPTRDRYPLWSGDATTGIVGLTRSNFVQNTLGFQIRWDTMPERPGGNTPMGGYWIIVPQWFPLLFCPIFPLLWFRPFRRRRRRQYRLANGLCLACGYDLRGHKTGNAGAKCPECATPIPAQDSSPSAPASS